jgi:hypothetical protein
MYQVKGVSFSIAQFDMLRNFIKTSLEEVKHGKITKDEFVAAIESCINDQSPLGWDDVVLIRTGQKE